MNTSILKLSNAAAMFLKSKQSRADTAPGGIHDRSVAAAIAKVKKLLDDSKGDINVDK